MYAVKETLAFALRKTRYEDVREHHRRIIEADT